MHINDLPNKILEDIFYMHVYMYRQSRLPLLGVCRKWYNTTNNHSSLWRTIAFYPNGSMPPVKVETYSLNGLAQLVNKVGDATFNLILGCPYFEPIPEVIDKFKTSVPKDWLSRCHTFTLHGPEEQWRIPDGKSMGNLLHSYSYEGLERLEILHTGTVMWERMLEQLMDRIEETSLNLHYLKVECGYTTEQVVKSVIGRPNILARIQNFSTSGLSVPLPWEVFANLEELAFSATKNSNLTDIVAPRLTKLSLEGDFAAAELPSKIFDQLTHLTLEMFKFSEGNVVPLQLPSLLSLTLIWTEFDLHLIVAPKLDHFEYRTDPYDENPYAYPSFENVVFRPRIIRLDVLSDEGEHDHFGEPLKMWKKCEELHLVTFRNLPEIGETLTGALSGTTNEQCWPGLKSLTVLYPAGKGGGPTQEEKKAKVEDALSIRESRVRLGLKPLERLEVGWYWTNDNDYVLEETSREWWVTIWVDCLKK